MGWIALYIFLGSIFLGMLSILVLAYCLYGIYKTVRYGYKDLKPWMGRFQEFAEEVQKSLTQLEERGAGLASMGEEMRRNVDDIRDIVEEIRSHPMVWTAGKISRFI